MHNFFEDELMIDVLGIRLIPQAQMMRVLIVVLITLPALVFAEEESISTDSEQLMFLLNVGGLYSDMVTYQRCAAEHPELARDLSNSYGSFRTNHLTALEKVDRMVEKLTKEPAENTKEAVRRNHFKVNSVLHGEGPLPLEKCKRLVSRYVDAQVPLDAKMTFEYVAKNP